MQGLARVPGDPPAPAPRPSTPGERSKGTLRAPRLRAGRPPTASGYPVRGNSRGSPAPPGGATARVEVGWGQGSGWKGRWGEPTAARLRSPARPPRHPPGPGRAALARPPAEPGAVAGPGSGAAAQAAPGPGAALGAVSLSAGPAAARRHRGRRRRAQKHFSISRQARRRRPGLARGRAGVRRAEPAGCVGAGPADRRAPPPPRALKPPGVGSSSLGVPSERRGGAGKTGGDRIGSWDLRS